MWKYKLEDEVVKQKKYVEKICDKCNEVLQDHRYSGTYDWTLNVQEWWSSYGDHDIVENSLDLCESCYELAIEILKSQGFQFNRKDTEIPNEI